MGDEVERGTAMYIVRKEIQRKRLKEKAGRRAWLFTKRLVEAKRSEIARRRLKELRERN